MKVITMNLMIKQKNRIKKFLKELIMKLKYKQILLMLDYQMRFNYKKKQIIYLSTN